MQNYRCTLCGSPHSVTSDRIFDGRLIFKCSKCKACAIVQPAGSTDEAYLEFLDTCEAGTVARLDEMDALLEQEKIVRPKHEIEKMISRAGLERDELVGEILRSRTDYIVEFCSMQEPPPAHGGSIEDMPVDEQLISALKGRGITRLYDFQERAIKEILKGRDVAITAPTASGKTEAFVIPVIQKISESLPRFGTLRPQSDEGGKISALFVYPTKALSRDQLPKIIEFAEAAGLRAGLLDGDSPDEERQRILASPPDIVITNFDVLHYHMLHRTKFSRLVRSVRFLVVDEAHIYTGIFGSNVHHIVSRLERIAGARIQIIAASATLPNASEFCRLLFGREFQVIEGSGRAGRIELAMIFPSLRSQRSLSLDLIRQTTKRKHRTIAFSNSHLGSELTAFYATRQGISIRVHRAGLSPATRKQVEAQFKSGSLSAISATPTLELGIDIGDVDAIVSNIVPVNRLVQRIGRAGRRGQKGYAFLALGSDPISQYYKSHPSDYLADREYAYADPSNPFVTEYQVLARVLDRPMTMAESKPYWNVLQKLVAQGLVASSRNRFVADTKKALEFLGKHSIRGIGPRVDIKVAGRLAGERSLPMALEELHPNAIYFLAGRRYRVSELHFEKNTQPYAELVPVPADYPYYTKALTDEWPSIVEVHGKSRAFGVEAQYCTLKIRKQVIGYSNMEIGQEAGRGKKVMLDKPLEFEFLTKGFVFRAPRPEDLLGRTDVDPDYVETSAYHASEHVVIEGSSMITGGASQDLGGISLGSSGFIFVYDGSIGGNGASMVLYERLEKAFERAYRIVLECPCVSESGCPRCTYSYRCGNNNEFLHKKAALEVLQRIVVGREPTDLGDGKPEGDRALV